MAEVLAGQLSSLRGLTAGLEDALSASLCSCKPLTEDAFLSFQRIDYMRQSLRDMERMLAEFGPSFTWKPDSKISRSRLEASVDMGDSIAVLLGEPPPGLDPPAEEDDAGTPDLW
ncbi:hypothetical protein KM176_05205 [Pseudooceanicola sp. CBS1P-1]|uniref:Uncharacterized protein n=1 Tax=Pseudooceanicola albus TaxID=2692189 RepID=A0A6L7FZ83_9RHOB|nr:MULTISPECIES: hypothetical protein [Pseudooceanicola]MBT9383250.1 hypothetical protein [Pseudooceanicola endophyticus]MXN16427.1 hypothetical protein [Pseudooceanicola albus]